MLKCIYFIALSLILTSMSDKARAQSYFDDVVICNSCSSVGDFETAARVQAGTSYNGIKAILVTNIQTQVSRSVNVTNVPDGQVPAGSGGTTEGSQGKGNRKQSEATMQSGYNHVESGAIDGGFQQQINAVVGAGNDGMIIVLPNNGNYPSYNGSTMENIANAIANQMSASYGANWVTAHASASFWNYFISLFTQSTGNQFQVCLVFNNGDNACYVPIPGQVSVANPVSGSQQNYYGGPIGGGGGGGGMNVSYQGTIDRINFSWAYITIACYRSAITGELYNCLQVQ